MTRILVPVAALLVLSGVITACGLFLQNPPEPAGHDEPAVVQAAAEEQIAEEIQKAVLASPQAAFDEFRTGMLTKDWRRVYHALTPESQKHFVIQFVTLALAQQANTNTAELQGVLSKHGVDLIQLRKLKEADQLPYQQWSREILAQVYDRERLFEDMMHVMMRDTPNAEHMLEKEMPLERLQVDGREATATFDEPAPDVPTGYKRRDIAFRKVGGSWRCQIDPRVMHR